MNAIITDDIRDERQSALDALRRLWCATSGLCETYPNMVGAAGGDVLQGALAEARDVLQRLDMVDAWREAMVNDLEDDES